MNDQATAGHGWEHGADTAPIGAPSSGAAAVHPAPDGTATAVADRPTYAAPAAPAASAAPRRTLGDRARAVPRGALAALGAALLVIAVGIGGFAVGRATAPDGGTSPTGVDGGQQGFRGGPGAGQGFPGGGPGQGQQGTIPGQGTGGTGSGTSS